MVSALTITAWAQPNGIANEAAGKANIGDSAAVALGMKDRPEGVLFEAEEHAAATVVNLEGALGGKAVCSDNDWQPLVNVALPEGNAWKVWIRHQGGPFCIKTRSGDRWFWQNPDKFSWTETDVFSREELGGSNLVVGRGDGGAKPDSPCIDAVVLKPDVKQPLPPDKPDSKKTAQKIAVSIDWTKTRSKVPAMMWGINEQQVLSVEGSADKVYASKIRALGVPLIRIHQGDLVSAWTDAGKKSWDIEKIKAAFRNANEYYGKARVMLCISSVPSWIAGGHSTQMTEAQENEYATFCAQLVRILRDDVKRPIDYWEITNEWDNDFERSGQLDKLWRIYNKCAAAMHREAPNAKLGGATFSWAKGAWVEGFLQNCRDLQFLTWHNYGTGNLFDSNEKIFESVSNNIGANSNGAMDLLKKYARGRKIETFLTEYNVKYTWDPYERRHQNAVGAVFIASVVKELSELGLSGAALWVQKGNAYGSIINGSNQTQPAYGLFSWGPKYLSGKTVVARSGNENLLEILPVMGANGTRSVLLINKANHTLTLPAAKTLLPNVVRAEQINTEKNLIKVEFTGNALSLPGYSLTLLTSAK